MTRDRKYAFVANQLKRPIVLIGMMGAGKTTVGRRLASMLSIPFFDADTEIERSAGMRVADFFETYGEEEFRHGETRVIERLFNEEGIHVLATGGGAFIRPQTRQIIQARGISIWLKADLDLLVARTGRRDTRPLLRQGNPREILEKLSAIRDPFYGEAHITVESVRGPHKDVVKRILMRLETHDHIPPTGSPEGQTTSENDR